MIPKLDIIPTSPDLSVLEQELVDVKNREFKIRDLIREIGEFYDYIFNGKFTSSPPSYLIQYYRLVRYGIRRLQKKLYGLKSHIRLPS